MKNIRPNIVKNYLVSEGQYPRQNLFSVFEKLWKTVTRIEKLSAEFSTATAPAKTKYLAEARYLGKMVGSARPSPSLKRTYQLVSSDGTAFRHRWLSSAVNDILFQRFIPFPIPPHPPFRLLYN